MACGLSACAGLSPARAMNELPYHGQSLEKVESFKREVNVLMGEALLQSDTPQPQVRAHESPLPRHHLPLSRTIMHPLVLNLIINSPPPETCHSFSRVRYRLFGSCALFRLSAFSILYSCTSR